MEVTKAELHSRRKSFTADNIDVYFDEEKQKQVLIMYLIGQPPYLTRLNQRKLLTKPHQMKYAKNNAAVQRPASKNSSSKRRPSTGSIKAVRNASEEGGREGRKASVASVASSVEAPSDDIKLITVSYVNERVSAAPFRNNTARILDQMIIRIGRLMKEGVKSKIPSIVSDRCFRKMTSSTHITPEEFKASLAKLLGEEIPETMVLDLFTKIDVDSDGKISQKDFITTFFKEQVLTDGGDGDSSFSTALSPEEHVDELVRRFREKIDQKLHSSQDRFRHILKLFDNTSERITPHIFRNAAFKAGLVLNEADAIALFKELDSEGTGKLSIHDILRKIEIKVEPANTATGNFIDNFEQQKSSGPNKVVHNSSGPDTQVTDADTALLLARSKLQQLIKTDRERIYRARTIAFPKVGYINPAELQLGFKRLGLGIDSTVAEDVFKALNLDSTQSISVHNFLVHFLGLVEGEGHNNSNNNNNSSSNGSWIEQSEEQALRKLKSAKEIAFAELQSIGSTAINSQYDPEESKSPTKLIEDYRRYYDRQANTIAIGEIERSDSETFITERHARSVGDTPAKASSGEGEGINNTFNNPQQLLWRNSKASLQLNKPKDLQALHDLLWEGVQSLTSDSQRAREILLSEFSQFDTYADQSASERDILSSLAKYNIELPPHVLGEFRKYYITADSRIAYSSFVDDVVSGTISNLFKIKSAGNAVMKDDVSSPYFDQEIILEEEEEEEAGEEEVEEEAEVSAAIPVSRPILDDRTRAKQPPRPSSAFVYRSSTAIASSSSGSRIPQRPASAGASHLGGSYVHHSYIRPHSAGGGEGGIGGGPLQIIKYTPINLAYEKIGRMKRSQLGRKTLKRQLSRRDGWLTERNQAYHTAIIDAKMRKKDSPQPPREAPRSSHVQPSRTHPLSLEGTGTLIATKITLHKVNSLSETNKGGGGASRGSQGVHIATPRIRL